MLPAVRRPSREATLARVTREAASVTAGAGVVGLAVSIADQSTLAGVIAGFAGWVIAGMAIAIPSWRRFRRAAVPEPVDPWALPEPWRNLVAAAVDAQRRFGLAVDAWPPGPLHERLSSMQPAVERQVRAVWNAARQGATLTGGYPPGSRRVPIGDISAELAAVQAERREEGLSEPRLRELDRAEEAVAARLREATRAAATAAAVEDGLRVAIARLDGAVTSLAELTAVPGGAADVEGLTTSIQSVTSDLSALQASLSEAAGALPGAPTP